ncbi:mbt repeat protein [Ancylostoma ceylanicum]|uniref:Mbt repeat protein n=1 Tax=Ancylostoma ceylanicum TaxID=53326 RepID=A0A0D6M996_9BILA|nr:mbt repeat protein [Ancylostoma ceylanicum]
MADVVPEAEEFGNDVPMDPIMEREGSEHSEELELSEAHDSEGNPDDAGENEEPAEQFNQNAEPGPAEPKHDAESSAEQSSPAKSSFDWDVYLREQNAEAAPRECFFQPETASENKFQIGKKLMIADPRGPSGSSAMFCLGTVVNVYKLWLCVRLEGLDNSHEKWIFCDDDSIQPIGDSAEDHMKLNPPIGFIHHHGTFPKFLEQHLRPDDETGESMLCPAEWFHPSQIQIHFDGWNNGYDIKEPYTTRYVMPVGWSQRNGVEISPPKSGGKSVFVNIFCKNTFTVTVTHAYLRVGTATLLGRRSEVVESG